MPIRVVVAEDHAFVRAGLCRMLKAQPDIEVVGEAANGRQALTLVDRTNPDVLLLDVQMPEMNGLQVARRLMADGHSVRILVISAYQDREFIQGMLQAGASGYLTKEEAPRLLIKAVRTIARSPDVWLSARSARRLGLQPGDDGR